MKSITNILVLIFFLLMFSVLKVSAQDTLPNKHKRIAIATEIGGYIVIKNKKTVKENLINNQPTNAFCFALGPEFKLSKKIFGLLKLGFISTNHNFSFSENTSNTYYYSIVMNGFNISVGAKYLLPINNVSSYVKITYTWHGDYLHKYRLDSYSSVSSSTYSSNYPFFQLDSHKSYFSIIGLNMGTDFLPSKKFFFEISALYALKEGLTGNGGGVPYGYYYFGVVLGTKIFK